jgi:hypothetical protein
MIQEALFEAPAPLAQSAMLPPEPPKLAVVAESLGPCVKCGKAATVASPGGSIYCAEHGKCGGKSVRETALGIDVRVCSTSVEDFVLHPRMGIWCCPCVRGA